MGISNVPPGQQEEIGSTIVRVEVVELARVEKTANEV
jgi:hypothetical protein